MKRKASRLVTAIIVYAIIIFGALDCVLLYVILQPNHQQEKVAVDAAVVSTEPITTVESTTTEPTTEPTTTEITTTEPTTEPTTTEITTTEPTTEPTTTEVETTETTTDEVDATETVEIAESSDMPLDIEGEWVKIYSENEEKEGKWHTTAYWATEWYQSQCGEDGHGTSSGAYATQGRTCAVNEYLIKTGFFAYGDVLYIDDYGIFVVEDIGTDVETIDIFFNKKPSEVPDGYHKVWRLN